MAVQTGDLLQDTGPRDIGVAGVAPRSFRAKLIQFGLGVALVSSLIMATANYTFISKVTRNAAVDLLAAEARTLSARFTDVFGDFQSDAELLSNMPPIAGIIRTSREPDGLDPLDSSTTDQWRHRLEVIFAHFLLERPHYTQMRYIGLADNGREIVRVDRTPEGIKRTPPEDLQAKGNEPYVQRSLKLGPQGVQISKVTYNREKGKVDPSLTPTIRMVVPVFDGERNMFGFIVINADYPAMLQRAFEGLQQGHALTMVNDQGDYLERRPGDPKAAFHFHEASDWTSPPFLRTLLDTDEAEALLVENSAFAYLVRIPIGAGASFLGIIASAPEDVILAGARGLLQQNLLLALAMVLLASLGATLLGWRLTRPLRWLTATIANRSGHSRILDLPVEGRDEISDLARAFQRMSNELIESTEASKESEARLSAVVETAPIGILSVDQEGVVISANDMAAEIFGYHTDELTGMSIAQLIPSRLRDRHQNNHLHFLENDDHEKRFMAVDREVNGLRKDGEEIPLKIGLSKVTLADGSRQAVATIEDISESKAAAEALRSYAKDLERSNTDLDEFAYVASHDLKAPLRVIDNASKWLEEDLGQHLDEDSRENMQLLRGRVKRMERLLDDLLEYSRVGRKTDARFAEPIRGDVLVDDVLLLLAPPAGFKLVISPAFAEIEVKRMPLQQILHNLINNAIKHHDREDGRIELVVEDQGDCHAFTVIDDGPGIPPEFHDQIFKMFQTLKPRDQVEGSGMGLAVVRKQIETFGGRLTLQSAEGEGSAFRFTWPKDQQLKEGATRS